MKKPSPGFSFIVRLELQNKPGMLSKILAHIAEVGGDMDCIDISGFNAGTIIRELTINARDENHEQEIIAKIKTLAGVKIDSVSDCIFDVHRGGKLEVTSRIPLNDKRDLSRAYTPGVARVCTAIHRYPELVHQVSMKGNMVAVVTDGTAVLGLGDIGPAAALPVMEGKAILFKRFSGVNAFPICLDTKDPEEIIRIVRALAPGFGGINLEDISAPRCFEIEARLSESLDIPVFHDDQHGTAVVVLAALTNAARVVGKKLGDLKVVVNGAGAAGTSCARLMMEAGVKNLILCDTAGALWPGRPANMNPAKEKLARETNPKVEKGALAEVIRGADAFLGVSGPDCLHAAEVKTMAAKPIVFALSNPTPEVSPESLEGIPGIIMATGRSDYPNQINNVLCFPGIFRGALDARATKINTQMKMAAAKALASIVSEEHLSAEYIIPSAFDASVAPIVAKAVFEEAVRTGVVRKSVEELPSGIS